MGVYLCSSKTQSGRVEVTFCSQISEILRSEIGQNSAGEFFFPSVNCRRGAAAAGGEMQCNALARDRVLLALRWIAIEMQ